MLYSNYNFTNVTIYPSLSYDENVFVFNLLYLLNNPFLLIINIECLQKMPMVL